MTENKSILKVLNGYMNLSSEEQRILIIELNEYIEGDISFKFQKKRLVESRMDVGPTDSGHCPCCGRG
jgi:hypothetical protein